MNLVEFSNLYAKENGIKLAPHEKHILKSIQEGKMFYNNPKGSTLQDVLDAYKTYQKSDMEE